MDSNNKAPDETEIKLRQAARALGKAGLAHAYGHCSVRLDENHFLVCAPEPMATIKPHENGTVVCTTGELPAEVLGEVRIHQHIYRLQPQTGAVCRIMPPAIMTLSTQGITPRARHGLSAYFCDDIPLWDNPRLLRNSDDALALVERMGDNLAIVMRGNGAVVKGETLEQAVTYSWFLEDAGRIELAIRCQGLDGESGILNPQEIADRNVTSGRVFERMWRHLTDGDPEIR